MRGYDPDDTIAAIATPLARSALGMLRLSGPRAWEIALNLAPAPPAQPEARRAYVLDLLLPGGDANTPASRRTLVERAVLTLWAEGRSYSGEAMAELSLHGNPLLLQHCLAACVAAGARPAEPGEFTLRAYLSGRLDLAQAEAVAELIGAGSLRGLTIASTALAGHASQQVRAWCERLTGLLAGIEVIHDYASDDLDSSLDAEALLTAPRLQEQLAALSSELAAALQAAQRAAPLRAGVTVALCGPPNVGKSTLFNALLGCERALTAPEPGTTRDYVSETLEAAGLRLTLVDTAGYRDAAEAVEAAGVRRAGDWARAADRVLWTTAADQPPAPMPLELARLDALQVVTRCDRLANWPEPQPGVSHVSGLTGRGVSELWRTLSDILTELDQPDTLHAFSERQAGCIARALDSLAQAAAALAAGLAFDAVAIDLHTARESLHGVYEQADRAAVIAQVFSRFCVGK